ncbi:MAG: hypothetical protein ACI8PP_000363 [Candidatus Pseudothioglobus sp.]|jgi:hypothetical protein
MDFAGESMHIWFAVLLICLSTNAFGWGATGHRVTGDIAERYMAPQTQARVNVLLGTQDLAQASTYADDMRSSPDLFWQKTASPWHYVTVPAGKRYSDVGAPPQGDAMQALTQFAATLRDADASLDEQRLALKFAIHLIGDLHQPLHVGNGTDRGGNNVKLQWFGEPSNLHRVWDTDIIASTDLSYTELSRSLDRGITPSLREQWREPNPLVWIAESAALLPGVYPAGKNLGYDYRYTHLPTLERRLSQAGVRIAAWLDWVYAPH